MAEIVERLIELITETVPLEEKVSGVVAGMIEKTANRLARFEINNAESSEDVSASIETA